MAHQPSWTDYIQLIITVVLVGGFVGGAIFLVRTIQETVACTKANLKAKGFDVTKNGIHIKTDKRMDRESYMDATHRGFINGVEALKKAGSFNNSSNEERLHHAAQRSATHLGEKEKGSKFDFKRRTSY